jgi:Tfp pilus assembly protein PilF
MVATFLRRIRRSSPRPEHYIWAAVFCTRLLVLAKLTGSGSFLPSGGDAHFYDEWARRIAAGRWTDYHAFYGLPLYAYWLAVLYKTCGYTPFVPALVQIALDSATAALIFLIGRRVFASDPASEVSASPSCWPALAIPTIAAVGWGVFVPAEVYSVILMPTALGVFAFWLVIFHLVKHDSAPTPRACLWFGSLIGFAAMGVATVAVLVPLILAAVLLKPLDAPGRATARVRVRSCILLSCGLVLGSAPCWAHNFLVARDPVILSAHGGVNFWIGNNPEATGYPHFPGLRAGQAEMLEDSISVAEQATGRALKRSEVSAYWAAKAGSYIRSNPVAWLKLLLRKMTNFWNAFEYDDLSIIGRLTDEGVAWPGVHFGLIAALGLAGSAFAMRTFPRARWLGAAIFLQMAAVLPVFVTERYRIAVVPGLLLFAGFGAVRLWRSVAQFNFKQVTVYIVIVGATTAFVSLPPTDPSLWALAAYNTGRQALERGDVAKAETDLLRARAYAPGNAEVSFVLGNVHLAKGDRAGARQYYTETLTVDHGHKRALNNLGLIALEERAPGTAESYLRRALGREPGSATTHYLLARALHDQQKLDAAMVELEEAIRMNANQPEFLALREQFRQETAAVEKQ